MRLPCRVGAQHCGWACSPRHLCPWSTESNGRYGPPHRPARKTAYEHRHAFTGVGVGSHSPSKAGASTGWRAGSICDRVSPCAAHGYAWSGSCLQVHSLLTMQNDLRVCCLPNWIARSAPCHGPNQCPYGAPSSGVKRNRHSNQYHGPYLIAHLDTDTAPNHSQYLGLHQKPRLTCGSRAGLHLGRAYGLDRCQQTPRQQACSDIVHAITVTAQTKIHSGMGVSALRPKARATADRVEPHA